MVIWTRPARDDLKQIHDFIKKDSAFYAKKIVADILAGSESLTELPRLGRVVPEIGDEHIREIPIHAYRLMYEIRGDATYILALVHKRRNFTDTDVM